MAAQTFTVNNNGSVSLQIVRITFNTPDGIQHTSDLTNFGGSASFTGAEYAPGSLTLGTGQSKTFTVDHAYVSGTNGTRNGTITIVPNFGNPVTINTTINVSGATQAPAPTPAPTAAPTPAPAAPTPAPTPAPTLGTPTYFLGTSSFNYFGAGAQQTWSVDTTNVVSGTTMYWKILETGGTPPTGYVEQGWPRAPQTDFVATSGSFQINEPITLGRLRGSFTIQLNSTISASTRMWTVLQVGTQPGATGTTFEVGIGVNA